MWVSEDMENVERPCCTCGSSRDKDRIKRAPPLSKLQHALSEWMAPSNTTAHPKTSIHFSPCFNIHSNIFVEQGNVSWLCLLGRILDSSDQWYFFRLLVFPDISNSSYLLRSSHFPICQKSQMGANLEAKPPLCLTFQSLLTKVIKTEFPQIRVSTPFRGGRGHGITFCLHHLVLCFMLYSKKEVHNQNDHVFRSMYTTEQLLCADEVTGDIWVTIMKNLKSKSKLTSHDWRLIF